LGPPWNVGEHHSLLKNEGRPQSDLHYISGHYSSSSAAWKIEQ